MRAYAMKKIGEVGWIEKERPSCAGSNENKLIFVDSVD